MKSIAFYLLLILLLTLLSGCSTFRKENPLNVKCPNCGYIWERATIERY